jgi:hypothetical protein
VRGVAKHIVVARYFFIFKCQSLVFVLNWCDFVI